MDLKRDKCVISSIKRRVINCSVHARVLFTAKQWMLFGHTLVVSLPHNGPLGGADYRRLHFTSIYRLP